ncbi:FliM/FliN family flagellar motor switch protein [Pseudomonas rossensis]|uniref:FliM/FliN family flagellar motor switch protein n=1 Tax=Pseudomonas rossensis TaxID=2305471 RepID=UPI003261BD75
MGNDNVNQEPEQDLYDEENTDTHGGMEEAPDEEQEDKDEYEEQVEEEQSTAIDPLYQMPLELTLCCGILILTLGDLRRLAPGTVLEVTGTLPGHATLCHGERVVAEGELVDVDGRLGLQLTRTAFHP